MNPLFALIRLLGLTLLGCVLLPVLAFGLYDAVSFLPHRGDMGRIVHDAAPDERDPPAQVRKLLATALEDPRALCTRLLLAHYGETLADPGQRRLQQSAWETLVGLHLSDADRVTLILALAPTGPSRAGVAATADALYGRPLAALSMDEAATVVALIVSPTAADDPALLATLKNVLILRTLGA